MKLHIFNPDHDLALAANRIPFTAPHAGRALRYDLSFLPAIWAEEGDFVYAEHPETARQRACELGVDVEKVSFVNSAKIAALNFSCSDICPWGWNKVLSHELAMSLSVTGLPAESVLDGWRTISGRQWAAAHLLPFLRRSDSVGDAFCLHTVNDVTQYLALYESVVLKAPWSCSGRGIRYVTPSSWDARMQSWTAHVLQKQGAVMLEPYYNKVLDFGMEFKIHRQEIRFLGLSLFRTLHGAYSGSVVSSEEYKQEILTQYVGRERLDQLSHDIIALMSRHDLHGYEGCFGVDMMIVSPNSGEGFKIHPCVELNMRRTMGHVALDLAKYSDVPQLMRIEYDGRYRLRMFRDYSGVEWDTEG